MAGYNAELEAAFAASLAEQQAVGVQNEEAAMLASIQEAERAAQEEEEMARIVSMQEAHEETKRNFLEKMNESRGNPNRRKRLITMAAINSKLHGMRMAGNANVANVENAWAQMQGDVNSTGPLNANVAYQTATALSANVNDNIRRQLTQKNKNMTNAEAAQAARVQETLRQMAANRNAAAAAEAASAAAAKANTNAKRKAAFEARYGPGKKGGRRRVTHRHRVAKARRATRKN